MKYRPFVLSAIALMINSVIAICIGNYLAALFALIGCVLASVLAYTQPRT